MGNKVDSDSSYFHLLMLFLWLAQLYNIILMLEHGFYYGHGLTLILKLYFSGRLLTLVQATSWDVDRAHWVAAAITRFCWTESSVFWATFLALSTRAAAALATALASCISMSCQQQLHTEHSIAKQLVNVEKTVWHCVTSSRFLEN